MKRNKNPHKLGLNQRTDKAAAAHAINHRITLSRPELHVTSGSRNKISLKCAITNKSIQNGRPGRYRKLQRNKRKPTTHPHPQPEKTPRQRSIPEIAVRCHLPRKTSQLTAEPEEWSKRNSEVCIVFLCHLASPRLADTDA